MKKYFVKFLPVSEEYNYLSKGDRVKIKNSDDTRIYKIKNMIHEPESVIKLKGNNHTFDKTQLILAIPFLCTHKVKQGETFINTNDNEEYTAIDVINFGMGITNIYPFGKNKLGLRNTEVYKVIGEIPSYNKWIKDGNKFSKKDVIEHDGYRQKDTKYLEAGDKVTYRTRELFDITATIVKVELKEENCSDWEDKIYLTNVKQGAFKDDNQEIELLDDVIVKREEIIYNGDPYKYFSLKCPKCKKVH